MRALPFLPPLLRPSAALIRATLLELVILAGHALLYPTGVTQERRPHGPPGGEDPFDARSGLDSPDPLGAPDPADTPGAPPAAGPGDTGPADTGPARDTYSRTDSDPPRLPAPAARRDRPPVLLLHGFIDNRSVFVLLRRSLRQHGWDQVEALNYSPLSCDIRTAAALLGRHIEQIRARSGHDRVDVVGHSLGGLIARYYVQRQGGDARVRTLITLGTPHSGTRAVPLLTAHPLVRQMRPDSDVIEELTRPAPNCTTQFVSFWSDLDQLMIPLETARIDHPDLQANNVQVSGIGHLALSVHGAVAAGIRRALDMETPGSEASEAASVA